MKWLIVVYGLAMSQTSTLGIDPSEETTPVIRSPEQLTAEYLDESDDGLLSPRADDWVFGAVLANDIYRYLIATDPQLKQEAQDVNHAGNDALWKTERMRQKLQKLAAAKKSEFEGWRRWLSRREFVVRAPLETLTYEGNGQFGLRVEIPTTTRFVCGVPSAGDSYSSAAIATSFDVVVTFAHAKSWKGCGSCPDHAASETGRRSGSSVSVSA